jgi:hypothetical protein
MLSDWQVEDCVEDRVGTVNDPDICVMPDPVSATPAQFDVDAEYTGTALAAVIDTDSGATPTKSPSR